MNKSYKNIVFDLGGVVVARDPSKCTREFIEFFSYVQQEPMPKFWSEYDRGAISFDGVRDELAKYRGVTREFCDEYVARTITMQEEVAPTKELIIKLKEAGYKLYVLSNMAHEYIEYIRTLPIYKYFDGDIVSSEVGTIKPEEEIYQTLLQRFNLDPQQTLFIDDRSINVEAAQRLSIDAFHFEAKNPTSSCSKLSEILL